MSYTNFKLSIKNHDDKSIKFIRVIKYKQELVQKGLDNVEFNNMEIEIYENMIRFLKKIYTK